MNAIGQHKLPGPLPTDRAASHARDTTRRRHDLDRLLFVFLGTGQAPQHPGEGTRSDDAPLASNKLGERLFGLAEMGVGSEEFIETSHLKHGLNPRIHAHKRQPASRPPARDVSLNQRPDPR